jgi:hypothetical protein
MQCYTQRAPASIAVAASPDRQVADLVYQGMTLAAMLWLLLGFWVF